MEDTHVWVIGADGSGRREVGRLDNRQGPPQWTADGAAVLAAVQERGSVRLYRFPLDGAPPSVVVPGAAEPGRVGAWSIASGNVLAYALETVKGPAELYVVRGREPARRVTDLNGPLLAERFLAEVDSLVFKGADGL